MHLRHATNGCFPFASCYSAYKHVHVSCVRAKRLDYICFYLKPLHMPFLSEAVTLLCAHMIDDITEDSSLTLYTLDVFKVRTQNLVYENILPFSIGVGDSCLDVVNIMADLTA